MNRAIWSLLLIVAATLGFACNVGSGYPIGDVYDAGEGRVLSFLRLAQYVRPEMTEADVLQAFPHPNSVNTFEPILPYQYLGSYYPVDRLIGYWGAKFKVHEGERSRHTLVGERRYVAFLFYRNELKFFFVFQHLRLDGDNFVVGPQTSESYLKHLNYGVPKQELYPGSICANIYYLSKVVGEEGPWSQCYWARSDFDATLKEDSIYQGRLRNNYASQVETYSANE